MFGKFHEWPLRPSILLSMPFRLMFRAALDLFRKEQLAGESFEADVVNKYGRTLYEIFFKPYTEKFLFYSPSELHRDWAPRRRQPRRHRQARADGRPLVAAEEHAAAEAGRHHVPLPADRRRPLLGARWPRNIEQEGGRVLTGRRVDGDRPPATAGSSRSRAGDEVFPVENLVWTAPITLANRLLGIQGVDLEYLSTIFYNFEIDAPYKFDFQWTYYGGDEIFSRVSAPTVFAADHGAAGQERHLRRVHLQAGRRALAASRALHRRR